MATITLNREQARLIARLSTERQKQKDAKAREDAIKEKIAAFAPNVGDALVVNGVTVAKIVEGKRSGLDAEIVKRRAPATYALASKTTTYRTVKIA